MRAGCKKIFRALGDARMWRTYLLCCVEENVRGGAVG